MKVEEAAPFQTGMNSRIVLALEYRQTYRFQNNSIGP